MPAFPLVRVPREETLSDSQPGFAGGLNITGDAFELQPNQMTKAEEARLTVFGSVLKRPGTRRVHASGLSGRIQGGMCWRKADGSFEYLVVANGVLYTGGATYAIPMTWTSVTVTGGSPSLHTTNFVDMVAFRNGATESVFLADGNSRLFEYDPNAATFEIVAGTFPTKPLYLAVYNQRLFAISGTDQTINYSALNDGRTLGVTPNGGSALVRTFSNQNLTGIRTLRDSLAMFHVTGISRFVGLTQDDIAIATGVQGFSSDVGTLMPRSAVVVDGQCFFLSERGAYLINDAGLQALDTIEKPDPTTLAVSILGPTEFTTVTGVHDRINREIRWSIGATGVFVLQYRLGSWTGPWKGSYASPVVTAQWEAINSGGDTFVLFGGTDGFVRQADVTGTFFDDVLSNNTGGVAYTLQVTCHRMFTKSIESEKALRWGYLFADLGSSTSVVVSWNIKEGSSNYTIPNPNPGSFWNLFSWGSGFWGSPGASRFRIPIGGRGPYVDFTISDDGNSTSIFSRFEVLAFDLGPRG